jgi:hypothetical protein
MDIWRGSPRSRRSNMSVRAGRAATHDYNIMNKFCRVYRVLLSPTKDCHLSHHGSFSLAILAGAFASTWSNQCIRSFKEHLFTILVLLEWLCRQMHTRVCKVLCNQFTPYQCEGLSLRSIDLDTDFNSVAMCRHVSVETLSPGSMDCKGDECVSSPAAVLCAGVSNETFGHCAC